MKATINYKGFELTVDFDYQPEEKPELYYPGCGASIDINGIFLTRDHDIFDLIAAIPEGLEDIEQLLYAEISE